jgi:hypothetical protein
MNKNQIYNQDILFEQMTAISKAGAYDAILPKYQEMQVTIVNLEAERDILKIELKAERELLQAYKDAFNELRPKDAEVIPLGEVDREIEEELATNDDLKNINI